VAEPQTPAGKNRRRSAAAKPRQRKPRQSDDSQGSPGNPPANDSHGNPEDDPAASPASYAGSQGASSSPFVGNAGHDFEPRDGAPSAAEPAGGDPAGGPDFAPPLLDWWTPERAEKVLRGQGALTHALIGVGADDWRWQPGELDAVAPPMADAMNRVDVLRRFAPYADGIGALLGLGAYFQRSVAERRAVLAEHAPEPEPVTGQPADAPAPSARAEVARRRALDDVIERGRARAAAPTHETTDGVDWRLPNG
jgi:hypothetical protein